MGSKNGLWEVVCMVRGAVPAPQVVERLKLLTLRRPTTAALDGRPTSRSDSIETCTPCVPLDDYGQLSLLSILKNDPVLAVLGLRPRYLCSLLKRVLVEVEACGLPVCDELADAYGEALTHDIGNCGKSIPALMAEQLEAALGGSSSTQWLYKTFAYGPVPAAMATAQGSDGVCSNGNGSGSDELQNAAPAPIEGCQELHPGPEPETGPIPAEVTLRHVASLRAALRMRGAGDADKEGSDATAQAECGESGGWSLPALPFACAYAGQGRNCGIASSRGDCGFASAVPTCDSDMAAGVTVYGKNNYDGGAEYPCRWGLVSLRVSDNLLAGSTGCHEWEASFALAQWVLSHPERFRGRRVLELGCGVGLVAVALQRSGAALVAATDGSNAAVTNCAANLRLNGIRCDQLSLPLPLEQMGQPGGVVVCQLGWEEPLGVAGLACDMAVASDVLYDPDVVPVFVALLVQLLAPHGLPAGSITALSGCTRTDSCGPSCLGQGADRAGEGEGDDEGGWPAPLREAYIATLRRNPTTLELFLRRAEEASLCVETVDWRGGEVEGDGDGGSCGAVPVRFLHMAALDDPRVTDRLVLHRVRPRAGGDMTLPHA